MTLIDKLPRDDTRYPLQQPLKPRTKGEPWIAELNRPLTLSLPDLDQPTDLTSQDPVLKPISIFNEPGSYKALSLPQLEAPVSKTQINSVLQRISDEPEYEEEPPIQSYNIVNLQRRPKTSKRSKHFNCRETLI